MNYYFKNQVYMVFEFLYVTISDQQLKTFYKKYTFKTPIFHHQWRANYLFKKCGNNINKFCRWSEH